MTDVRTDTRSGRDDRPGTAAAASVPPLRLHLLRAGYLLIGVGLAVTRWPTFLEDVRSQPLMDGVVSCMLVALSVLALVGVRHPLRMIPLLLWEVTWKVVWLAVVGLPLWASGELDGAARDVASSCLLVVVVLAVLPWRHLAQRYGPGSGERWRSGTSGTP